MKRFLSLPIGMLMVLAIAAPALAADPVAAEGTIQIVVDGNATVPADEQVAVLVVVQGDALIQGTVNNVTVVGGTATVYGTIQTLTIVDGRADLLAGSRVLGDVVELNATVSRADGAIVGGAVRPLVADLAGFGLFLGAAAILIWIGAALMMLVAALALAAFAARQVRTAEAVISREPIKAFIAGLAMIIIPPLAIVLLALTVVGLPLALSLLLVVWPTLAFVGFLVGAIWIGEWMLSRTGRAPGERPYVAATVGLVVATVLGLVPIISAVISIFGLGAVTVAGWRTLVGGPRRPMSTIAQPAPAAG